MKSINVLLIALLAVMLIVTVSAETIIINDKEVNYQPASAWQMFFRTLQHNMGTYSIVGVNRVCGVNGATENKEIKWHGQPSYSITNCEGICSSNDCLIDLFESNSAYTQYSPMGEYKNSLSLQKIPLSTYLIAQIYCCPHPECTSISQCEGWYGTGSTCKTCNQQSCLTSTPPIGYQLTSYNYCSCREEQKTPRWYVDGDKCTRIDYCGATPSSVQGNKLYSSESTCKGNIPSTCTPKTCSQLGKTSGTWDNGCGTTINCGTGGSETTITTSPAGADVFINNILVGKTPYSSTTIKYKDDITIKLTGYSETGLTVAPAGVGTTIHFDLHREGNGSNIGEGNNKSISLTEEEFNEATPLVIFSAMCKVPSDCASRENYTTKCLFNEEVKEINKNAVESIKNSQTDLKSKICNNLDITWQDYAFPWKWGSLLGKSISKEIPGYDQLCGNTNVEISGTCRAVPSSQGLCSITSPLAFIPITGDKCTDGGIIIAVIALGSIILTRLNYGWYKYEI